MKKVAKDLAANSLSGYRISSTKEGAVQKSLETASLDALSKVRAPKDLSTCSYSGYVSAIFPIAIELPLWEGGREIAEPKQVSMIFVILAHCLNTTDVNNYCVRADGQWFCLDTTIKGHVPLSPLCNFSDSKVGSRRRVASGRDPTSLRWPPPPPT